MGAEGKRGLGGSWWASSGFLLLVVPAGHLVLCACWPPTSLPCPVTAKGSAGASRPRPAPWGDPAHQAGGAVVAPQAPFVEGAGLLLLVYPGRPTLGSGAPSPAQASPSTPARALDCCSSQQAWTTWSTVAGRVVSAFSELKDVLRWATCTTSLHCHDPALLPTGLEHPRGSLAEPLCGLTASAVWAGRVHARDRGRWSRCGVEQTLPA